jgi:hypothetical protein
VQHDDPQRPDEHPARRSAGRVRLVAVGLMAWGAYSLATSTIHLVHLVVPVLVVATVIALVATSRARRKP